MFLVILFFKLVFLSDKCMNFDDILIANEDEAKAYCGHTNEANALKALAENADVAVLKLGPNGSLVACQDQITTIAPMGSGKALDTTGAGDLWASGFLFGITGFASVVNRIASQRPSKPTRS